MIVQTLILTAHGDYFSNWFFYCSEWKPIEVIPNDLDIQNAINCQSL